MKIENRIKVRKKVRLYFPYCGYKVGFCLSENGCNTGITGYDGSPPCPYWRDKHPITKLPPQSLRSI